MSKLLTAVLFFGLSTAACAQAGCDTLMVVSARAADKVVTTLPAKLPASLHLQLAAAPKCPTGEFTPTLFEIALVRERRPVAGAAITTMAGADIDLSGYSKFAKSGDRFIIEVKEYDAVTSAGKEHKKGKGMIFSLPIK